GVVSGQTVAAGLREGRISGNGFDTTSANPGTTFTLTPVMGETSNNTPPPGSPLPQSAHIWDQNETWVYTGQFFVASGTPAFAENIDDNVLVKIDGVTVLNDTSWN